MDSNKNKKKKESSTSPESEDYKITPLDHAQINELLVDSIQNYVTRVKRESKNSKDAMNLIDSHVSEFLQAFVIFGYDMRGQPVYIQHAINQMDSDALNSLINRILFSRSE